MQAEPELAAIPALLRCKRIASPSINSKPILVVFGTRPEAIKICPIIKEIQMRNCIDVRVCITAQHREMLDYVFEKFDIKHYKMIPYKNVGNGVAELKANLEKELKVFYKL